MCCHVILSFPPSPLVPPSPLPSLFFLVFLFIWRCVFYWIRPGWSTLERLSIVGEVCCPNSFTDGWMDGWVDGCDFFFQGNGTRGV